MQPQDATFFQPTGPLTVVESILPHWDQPGTFAFITFRLKDSLPRQAVARWKEQRDLLLRASGVDPSAWALAHKTGSSDHAQKKTAALLAHLSVRNASMLKWKLFQAWDKELDELLGSCCLRTSAAQRVIADGLLKFDGHQYVIAAFQSEGEMVSRGAAWRQYFAREINQVVGRSGHLWQPDQFDHLVRSPESFDRIRKYIVQNPLKAQLRAGEYRLYVSADW